MICIVEMQLDTTIENTYFTDCTSVTGPFTTAGEALDYLFGKDSVLRRNLAGIDTPIKINHTWYVLKEIEHPFTDIMEQEPVQNLNVSGFIEPAPTATCIVCGYTWKDHKDNIPETVTHKFLS